MVEDFNSPVKVIIGETIREADGLAMSSRNKYLSPHDRELAPLLFRSLSAAKDLYMRGECNSSRITKEYCSNSFPLLF